MTKILLIEDDEIIATMYQEQLEEAGFEVQVAKDGQSGVNAAQNLPNLILLDILLPQANGFEVLKKLKENEKTRSIPVVILTNLGSESSNEDKNLALALGAEDYLVKSFHLPNEVISKVKTILSRQHA